MGRGRTPLADDAAIRTAAETIARRYPDARIGYPKIGAGLAGGDWKTISGILDEAFQGLDHTLVLFAG